MDDLMGKIQEVLSDEESMNQIKKLASMLGMDPDMNQGMANSNSDNSNTQSENANMTQPDFITPQNNSSQQKSNNTGFDFDINKIMALKGVIEQANKSDPSIDFIIALRPLLKEETQIKADKLIKIFRIIAIWPALKDSGLLGGDLLGLL